MDNTAKPEFFLLFLAERLPEPLTPASEHLQIFDNYIAGTYMRLRSIRDPRSKEWTRLLQKLEPRSNSSVMLSQIELNEPEYAAFESFEGREIRKNRYFIEIGGRPAAFDIFLGKLWGLNTVRVDFENEKEMEAFEPPPFLVFEVSGDPFFSGSSLVERTFADVQAAVSTAAATASLEP